ncbi:hypothetical protein [Xenorhabdus hominickii]|uniref:Uncharacterized protein n=1 Tax=Xenorhabdus hominickii TaxID=351679 RepID=A0A2G0Q2L3_XENHO|nr:hypothetical protein [Xenorhabdus hominickii]AOM39696.1 hypothetical protein A9255_03285 [Xenorhabdus hominickii]PHM53457.1 hypothetical protein Xhom_03455 [Xenorhabdus hominickii]
MQTCSLRLNPDDWDIMLDAAGDLAITQNPYAVAQDVACACSTFLGECWYDTTLGIPYYQRIFGHWPGTQLINAKMEQEALKLTYVQSASCTAVSDANRSINGVMVITDSNFNQMTVNL